MTITVKAAREALEAAHLAYKKADIEHPTATHIAKEALTHARHEYWTTCAEYIENLPAIIVDVIGGGDYSELCEFYTDITGETL